MKVTTATDPALRLLTGSRKKGKKGSTNHTGVVEEKAAEEDGEEEK